MAEWARSDLGTILAGVVGRLVAVTGLDATRVAVTVLQPEDFPIFHAPQDVLVRPMGEEPDRGAIDGAGRWHNLRTRTLAVSVRTRLHLDQAGRDLDRLADASRGHLRMEDLAVDALELWNVPGSGGDVITAPLRCGRWNEPQRLRQGGELTDWVYSTLHVECTYVRDLDASISTQFEVP